MNPDDLTTTVRKLRQRAFLLRAERNRWTRDIPTAPATAITSLNTAAQALDDAATDLLNAFGSDMPEEAI